MSGVLHQVQVVLPYTFQLAPLACQCRPVPARPPQAAVRVVAARHPAPQIRHVPSHAVFCVCLFFLVFV